jgi:hypothetical protein
VDNTRQTWGVLHEDIYNFNKTRFIIGVAATSKVVTSVNTISQATVIHPGNREWVTAIECINASGWSLLPFMILAGKLHQAGWYQDLLLEWAVALSDNGWITNELSLE